MANRNARSVQTTVGWIFWDPGAVARYQAAGLPEGFAGPLGYIAVPMRPPGAGRSRGGHGGIRVHQPARHRRRVRPARRATASPAMWEARDEAVHRGPGHLHARAARHPGRPWVPICGRWWTPSRGRPGVLRCPSAHAPARSDPVLSGWHAVNCLREWRGDTHWALVVAAGLTHAEASILHNAWLGYEDDWLPLSRGTTPEALEAGGGRSRERAWPAGRTVTRRGRRPAPADRGRHRPAHHAPVGAPRARTARSSSPSGSNRRARYCSAGWTRRPGPTTSPRRGSGAADERLRRPAAGPW